MSDEPISSPVLLTERPPPPPSSRRSRRHWKRIAAYRAKCQAEIDAILPETWEGQVRKPVESLQVDGEEATDTVTDDAPSDAGWCVVM